MRTAIVGPGRLGTLLATSSSRAGHPVVAVAGGSVASRTRLTALVAGVRTTALSEVARDAQLIVLAVPDDAIAGVVRALVTADALRPGHRLVHLAGARGTGELALAAGAGAEVAACHPAMTVPTGTTDPEHLLGAAWAVTASASAGRWAHEWVRDLGGDPHDVPEDRRPLYHAALTMGSNAVAAAVATARQVLLAAKVDDPGSFLLPLARASVEATAGTGAAALTGPVVRGDLDTLAGHLAALDRDVPELAARYRLFARATLATARPGLDPSVVAALTRVLADASDADVPDADAPDAPAPDAPAPDAPAPDADAPVAPAPDPPEQR
jgi:predicted short-subunit dehydrogenase-like oxidoreductase (DUF2520 family)